MFVSYAQNLEDVMLWRALCDVEHGFYVDLGAQDPLVDSVSLAFHERGWRGVHVEPSAFYAEALRQHRPGDVVIQAAVGDGSPLVTFFEIPNSGISTVDPAIAEQHRQRGFVIQESQVPSITLSAVLDACPGVIHWLKIDIEGSEQSALASWGSSSRRPWVVVIESTIPLSQVEAKHDWEALLLERDYKFVYFDGLNRFYVAKEKSELKSAFSSPPNVFDAFAVNGTASSWIHRRIEDRYREQADERAAAYRRLEEELQSKIERQHDAIAVLQRHTDELITSHAEQLRVADRRLLEESRTLNEHIRMLLADMQQREAHALEERERLHEAHREVQSSLEIALAEARAREKTTKDAWEAAEAALHGAQVDLEVARTRRALELDLRGAERRSLEQRLGEAQAQSNWLLGELERERLQAAAGPSMKDPLESVMLDQLRILNDVDFVRAAYRSLLKREADPTGERNYVELLRSGHDKVRLLSDMARSEEARRIGVSIPGLKGALIRRKLGRLPVVGPFALKVGSLFRRAPYLDPTAAMQQQALGMQRSALEIVVQLQTTVQKMQRQQMNMEQTLRRLSDRDS